MLQVFELIGEIAPTSRAVVLDTFSRSSPDEGLDSGASGKVCAQGVCIGRHRTKDMTPRFKT